MCLVLREFAFCFFLLVLVGSFNGFCLLFCLFQCWCPVLNFCHLLLRVTCHSTIPLLLCFCFRKFEYTLGFGLPSRQ